jgi:hypothetical protein
MPDLIEKRYDHSSFVLDHHLYILYGKRINEQYHFKGEVLSLNEEGAVFK